VSEGGFRVRAAHKRPPGSYEWMSTACAFRITGCAEADCCCTCHGPKTEERTNEEPQNER
jgi:hypothetical protein